ncbi:c-type cytochrome [Petrachloros mirabilis]
MKNTLAACVLCGLLLTLVIGVSAQDLRGSPKRGETLYQQHCLHCHGVAGDGMGPEAKYLVVPPANFHLAKHRIKTDIDLFIAIQDGVLFSPMHAWRRKLTDDQIKDLIAYIRFFAPFLAVS